MELYLSAAKKGDKEAYPSLGYLYYLKENYIDAFKYYSMAADSGDGGSLTWVAYLYENGKGVSKNLDKAKEYYEKAIDKNLPRAMILLGDMYKEGRGVPRDKEKARELYIRAKELGDEYGDINLNNL